MPGKSPNRKASLRARASGFSLLEMMVVVFVLMIIMGAVFQSINMTQKTSNSQQIKLDLTQQAREFVDQITTDLRNSGYPYKRNMTLGTVDPSTAQASPYNTFTSAYDQNNAPGLIYVDNGSLWFAASMDGSNGSNGAGSANVKIVRYDYTATGTNCPCLRRTEFTRNGGDPLTDAQNPGTAPAQLEIQGVQGGTTAADAIFTVYDATGTAITLPIDFDNNAQTLASINSLKIKLSVQSANKDFTGGYPVTTVVSSMALMNSCSEALLNGYTPPFCE
ncbi:MAG TPA: prepilin-type N-terminal cleavage/methylation domain-containing protein [Terriglobales bacterium]|jgi:type II secretory pathway pseudopilin PulG|nr:prepilin-type N-terminal cleavage/methylation domain-containing protein [Terriglobales bacterium]